MKTDGKLCMSDVFVGIREPRQAKKAEQLRCCCWWLQHVGYWQAPTILHWCMDVAFGDDPMRARTGNVAHNFAVVRHFALNLIRLASVKRKGGIKVRRLMAATSEVYRAELFGLI